MKPLKCFKPLIMKLKANSPKLNKKLMITTPPRLTLMELKFPNSWNWINQSKLKKLFRIPMPRFYLMEILTSNSMFPFLNILLKPLKLLELPPFCLPCLKKLPPNPLYNRNNSNLWLDPKAPDKWSNNSNNIRDNRPNNIKDNNPNNSNLTDKFLNNNSSNPNLCRWWIRCPNKTMVNNINNSLNTILIINNRWINSKWINNKWCMDNNTNNSSPWAKVNGSPPLMNNLFLTPNSGKNPKLKKKRRIPNSNGSDLMNMFNNWNVTTIWLL